MVNTVALSIPEAPLADPPGAIISTVVPRALAAAIRETARAEDRSVSSVVRRLLVKGLENVGDE